MECPICSGKTKFLRIVEGTPLLQCLSHDCRFVFLDLAGWKSPDIHKDYYSDWVSGRLNPAAPWIKARLNIVKSFKPTGVIADLGAGLGETAIALSQAGFSVVAIEESRKAINYLKSVYPAISWRNQNISQALEGVLHQFDAITMFHVLEHIPQPKNIIRLADNALKPGGVIVVEVPDVSGGLARLKGRRWEYFIHHHVNYFDKRSLGRLMGVFGYQCFFVQRTYHFSYPQGDVAKDFVKGTLARIGLNSIIRTVWGKQHAPIAPKHSRI